MKWASWAESAFPDGRWENESNYVAPCAFHVDGNPSMAIEVEKGVFVCRSCGARGRIEKLARQLGMPAVPTVSDDYLRRKLSPRRVEDTHAELCQPMPEAWLDQFDHWNEYWPHRFPAEIVAKFRLGYDPVRNCATIPVRNGQRQVIGVIRRRLDNRKPKYIDPKNLPKASLLWGWWEVPTAPDRLVICEGPADALACWSVGVPAVALCGAWMSQEQSVLVRRLAPKTILIGLDNDQAGRGAPYEQATKKPSSGTWRVRELLQGAGTFQVVVWSGKDPGDVDPAVRLGDIEWPMDWSEWKRHAKALQPVK